MRRPEAMRDARTQTTVVCSVAAEFRTAERARWSAGVIASIGNIAPTTLELDDPTREFRSVVRWTCLPLDKAELLHRFLTTLATNGGILGWVRVENHPPA